MVLSFLFVSYSLIILSLILYSSLLLLLSYGLVVAIEGILPRSLLLLVGSFFIRMSGNLYAGFLSYKVGFIRLWLLAISGQVALQ